MNLPEELDRIAAVYCEDTGFEFTLNKYKALELSRVCSGDTLLDVGCGAGFTTKALAPRFRRALGIDGSEAKLAKARAVNGGPGIEYHRALFEEFDFPAAADWAVACNVLEHVDDAQGFLRRVRRWVKPGGSVAMTVPNALGLHKRLGHAMGLIADFYALTADDHAKGHKRIYDSRTLRAEFETAGLAVREIRGILLKPLSHSQMETWSPAQVDALYKVGGELPDYCSSLLIIARNP